MKTAKASYFVYHDSVYKPFSLYEVDDRTIFCSDVNLNLNLILNTGYLYEKSLILKRRLTGRHGEPNRLVRILTRYADSFEGDQPFKFAGKLWQRK
jgi:hypothetical protein